MSIIGSTIGSLAKLAVVLVVVGVITGVAVSGTDLLNPKTSAAKVRQLDAETAHMIQVNTFQEQRMAEEIRHLTDTNRLLEQQLAAQNQLDFEYNQDKAELKLELLAVREYALAAGGALSLVIMSLGMSYLLVKLGQRWASSPQHAHLASNENAWKELSNQNARLLAAWARERAFRQAFVGPEAQEQTAPDDLRRLQTVIHGSNNSQPRREHYPTHIETN